MASNAAGPGAPVTNEQRIRYQPCFNNSDYDAPPFACMSRVYLNATGGDVVDGSWVVYVDRPNSITAARQSAADLVFNGPEVLKSKRPGRCTEDFPCRGLHLREDTLHQRPYIIIEGQSSLTQVSYYCGPKADSWLLWDSGFTHRWLHRDSASLLTDQFETGLIVPTPPPWIGATFETANGEGNIVTDVAVDASIGFSAPSSIDDATWVKVTQSRHPYVDDLIAGSFGLFNGIKFNTGGIYEWHFHCTLSSSAAPQGASLLITSHLDAATLEPYCQRANQLEIDNYGNEILRSAENVAMSGQVFILAGETLTFRNASAYLITCSAVFCTVRRVGP